MPQPIVGTVLPDFQLPGVDGKMVSMSNYATAKGFIIVFTSNTCLVSKDYEQKLSQINKWYSKKGFPLIVINSGEISEKNRDNSLASMTEVANRKKIAYSYLSDSTQAVAKLYNVETTPYSLLLVKEDGKYVSRYIGAIDGGDVQGGDPQDKYLSDAVEATIAGKSIEVAATPELGCPIIFNK
ncbi:MAG: redoxin domain-containing protein [Chitinophagaceae bacterium]